MGTHIPYFTPVQVPSCNPKIRYADAITMIGSCFAGHISQKLERYKYDVLTNPFGILYNPVSMSKSLARIADLQYYQPEELVKQDGLFHSMDHHGSFSGRDHNQVLNRINNSIRNAHEHLQKSAFIFVSPGTAHVHKYKPTMSIAGNCHKISQDSFDYFLLEVEACIKACQDIDGAIKLLNPDARVVWTVSPVRYMKAGLIANQRSKATLLMAIHHCTEGAPESAYFPAYEIMMDQLRDYRYYARDLVHPSEMAIDIIWEIFRAHYLDPQDIRHHAGIENMRRAMEHRFLHEQPEAIRRFARKQLQYIDQLASALPNLNWHQERQYFFQLTELD